MSSEADGGTWAGRAKFMLVAQNPAIDFANTVVDPGCDPDGAIRSWKDLIEFLKVTQSISSGQAAAYRNRPHTATLALALKLRDHLRAILGALASRGEIRPEWVTTVNRVLAARAGYRKLIAVRKRWELSYVKQVESPAEILFPIAEAVAAIVSGGFAAHVRKCGNPDCVLFFQDKTGRRRWCSMAICGNRAKVTAFARRQRARLIQRAGGRAPGSPDTRQSRR